MKKILAVILTCFAFSFAYAGGNTYNMYLPVGAGGPTDLVLRAVAEVYSKNTGNTIVPKNVTGANSIPGMVAFKQDNKPAIIGLNSSLEVFNHVLLKDLPYSDDDVDYVSGVTSIPGLWVVAKNSPYMSMKDLNNLNKSAKPFVGVSATFEEVNAKQLFAVNKWKEKDAELVRYKGAPDIALAIVSGQVDVGFISINPSLVQFIEKGDLRVLGHSGFGTMTIGGIKVPAAGPLLGTEQFTGLAFLGINKQFSKEEADKIKADLITAIKDPSVQEVIKKLNAQHMEQDGKAMREFVKKYRADLNKILK